MWAAHFLYRILQVYDHDMAQLDPTELQPGAHGVTTGMRVGHRAALTELGAIRVSGPDAIAFLQTQLTNDVAQQPPDRLLPTGYCTPKGRLLATFHQWREGDDVWLRLPRELAAPIARRLSMFVLRLKARVTVDDTLTFWSVFGPGAGDALRSAGLTTPTESWQSIRQDAIRVDRMPSAPQTEERFLLSSTSPELPAALTALPEADASLWWWSEIDAALPTVFASTQEKFVPQMINFEVIGGVNFRKGCYPGQEIVARSQYLGKLKRRMHVAHLSGDPPPAGADVFRTGFEQPVGTVVMAAPAPTGGSDLLFETAMDAVERPGQLHVGAPGDRLDIRPLPYALFDPTA